VRTQKGSVLVISLLVMLVATAVVMSTMNTSIFECKISGNYADAIKAFYRAEAGIETAISKIVEKNLPDLEQYTFSGDHFDVKIIRQLPNTINVIESIGHGQDGGLCKIQAKTKTVDLFPMPDFALWSRSDVLDHGVSGSILGEGPLGSLCDEVADVKYYDPLADIDIKKDLGPNEWIELDPILFPYESVKQNVLAHPELMILDLDSYSSHEFASEENPRIFYHEGDLNINASSGYGILVVNGNLELKGSILWIGFILGNGNVRYSGGGNKHVEGAVVSMGNVTRLDGGVDIWYNCKALQNLQDRNRSLKILYWKQL